MNQAQDWTAIVKIQPRGVITIPRRFRDKNFSENSFVKVKKTGGKLTLEPVTMVEYPVRRYTDKEVDEFFEMDKKESTF